MSEFARTLESWKGCDPKAMVGMSSAAIQYALSDAKHDIVKLHADFDRVTAERDAALGQALALERDVENWKRKACESADREHELQQRLTAADERVDVPAPSDWELGLEDADGHELVTVRADEYAMLKGVDARYRRLQKSTPYRFKKIQEASVTDGGDVLYFHADRFDAAVDAALKPAEGVGDAS